MKRIIPILLMTILMVLSSCYRKDYNDERLYDVGYNFVVKVDSMPLVTQQPEELEIFDADTFYVYDDERLVVADFRTIPNDSIDSVWVQLARDQETIGWIHEQEVMQKVTPDDPISWFIDTFSNIHVLVFLIVVGVIAVVYLLRHLLRRGMPIVHFNDIPSVYPTLLVLIVACSATFYASIQMFAPSIWQHFFYHPTLNPFAVPPILEIFLISVWLMLVVGLAAMDDVRRVLPFGQSILYLAGLAAVCAIDYLVFSVLTLYYIGYPLLVLYIAFAVYKHVRHNRTHFVCGNCGARLKEKGKCPHCGVINE